MPGSRWLCFCSRAGIPTWGCVVVPDAHQWWCNTGDTLRVMPTNHRRHAVTETPRVQAALDELRRELGTDRVELGELVVLGAGAKLASLRATRTDTVKRRARLADRVRARRLGVDIDAADEVRARGWARP